MRMTKLLPTKNDLPSNTKAAVIDMLNARVADTIDLALATKQAHWNIKGMNFIAVHEMLDRLRGALDTYVDDMAERVVQLGGVALGTSQLVEAETTLDPYPTDIHTTKEHLHALIERYGAVANAVRTNIDDSDEAGDAGTADLFTGVSRGLDEWLWMLEAHVGA
jgi:starvation-inducible DNA-binding protein